MKCCPDRSGIAGACFSPERRRRFVLWRNWDASKPPLAACMLNPSIADETDLDPTLRRVQRYAMDWGFGGMRIVNAFSLVSTDPRALSNWYAGCIPDEENDQHIADVLAECPLVMVGWGTNIFRTALHYRSDQLHRLLAQHPNVRAWKITSTGQPSHPLYLPAAIQPVPYRGVA